jgi:hypothetical protein
MKDEAMTFFLFSKMITLSPIQSFYTEKLHGLKLIIFQLNCFIQNLQPEIDLFMCT